MGAAQVIEELRRRNIHVRQYFDGRRFEVWADGQFHSWWQTPIDCELAIRKLLQITNEQGVAVENEVQRRLNKS